MRRASGLVPLQIGRAFGPGIESGLTEDQLQYVSMARDFAQREMAPNAAEWDRKRIFPEDCLRACAAQGFAGIYTPSTVGGTGLSRLDASLVFEQLSMADPSTTAYLTIHNMVTWMVGSFGCAFLQENIAPKLCSAEYFASYCLTEPGAGSDAARLSTTAKDNGDHWVVNGSKMFISGAGKADVYAVMVRTGGPGAGGISCVVILKDDPGVTFGKNEAKLGWCSQPTAMVNFENVKIPKNRLVGAEGEGFKIAMRGLDGGRVNISSCSIGGAQQCLDLATKYTQERVQFNQPIFNFQNTQFKLAEMAAKVHSSRLMVRQAAASIDSNDQNKTVLCAMAKMVATEQCYEVADQALQLHGGYGYLNDFPIERIMRDLRVHRILEGTNEVMRMIVGRSLGNKK
eukprot:GILI01020830.1.p1 GENE.GILI01020830.1~~GILI01020830.1.p1  ORF type:complete len:407 (-),score=31.48 GILI01020830.1:34-1233(-)